VADDVASIIRQALPRWDPDRVFCAASSAAARDGSSQCLCPAISQCLAPAPAPAPPPAPAHAPSPARAPGPTARRTTASVTLCRRHARCCARSLSLRCLGRSAVARRGGLTPGAYTRSLSGSTLAPFVGYTVSVVGDNDKKRLRLS